MGSIAAEAEGESQQNVWEEDNFAFLLTLRGYSKTTGCGGSAECVCFWDQLLLEHVNIPIGGNCFAAKTCDLDWVDLLYLLCILNINVYLCLIELHGFVYV